MKYLGTIKNKEKQLGNLRRFLTQNKERYFNQNFDELENFMLDLFYLSSLNILNDDDFNKVVQGYNETDKQLSKYLLDIFDSIEDLDLNIDLLIPYEEEILGKLYSDEKLEELFDCTMDLLDNQLNLVDNHVFDFSDFCKEFLTYLFNKIMDDDSKKMELIKDLIFKKIFFTSTKANQAILKEFFKEEMLHETVNIFLTDFYLNKYGSRMDNSKLPTVNSETKINLLRINFDLANPYFMDEDDDLNIFCDLEMFIEISGIGKILFNNNCQPKYLASLENRKIKLGQSREKNL